MQHKTYERDANAELLSLHIWKSSFFTARYRYIYTHTHIHGGEVPLF